jgi:hypothetical protein
MPPDLVEARQTSFPRRCHEPRQRPLSTGTIALNPKTFGGDRKAATRSQEPGGEPALRMHSAWCAPARRAPCLRRCARFNHQSHFAAIAQRTLWSRSAVFPARPLLRGVLPAVWGSEPPTREGFSSFVRSATRRPPSHVVESGCRAISRTVFADEARVAAIKAAGLHGTARVD